MRVGCIGNGVFLGTGIFRAKEEGFRLLIGTAANQDEDIMGQASRNPLAGRTAGTAHAGKWGIGRTRIGVLTIWGNIKISRDHMMQPFV
ncbi:MAG: hypothetical protein BWY71_01753 [Planctomycetes bacterium ADurb.Bin412]|nr:MAG: hypothetical protein BWY71_01753 [Planctomycetes bacterium ADurb.Bin412]